MEKFRKFLYPFLLLATYTAAYSQSSFDTSFDRALSVYTSRAGTNSHLYNGSQYIDYDHRITGNPFFEASHFADGSIVYDGIFFENVQMFYDILHDDVVIKNYNDSSLILVKEKISSFNYAAHKFVRLDSSETGIPTGFYDVLFEGKITLYARRKKEVIEKVNLQYSESYFATSVEYYILSDSIYHLVSDKRSVLQVMADKRADVTKFLHQNKIKFKKNMETDLIRTSAYYDGLKNTK
jgi:hypothetical protein